MTDQKAFPNILRALRGHAGLSQGQLAKKIRVDEQTVHRWERGTSKPRPKSLEALASALRTDVAVLTGKIPLLPDEPSPEQLRALDMHQLNVRVRGDVRNAFTLVSRRYGVTATRIVEIAPLLFFIAAEKSLQRRLERIEELRNLLDASDGLSSNFRHLPPSVTPGYRADDAMSAERRSIEANDIQGSMIPQSLFDGFSATDYDAAEHGPFVCYLRDIAKNLRDAAEVTSFADDWGVQYQVCRADALRFTNHDEFLADNILCGNIVLNEMPRELFEPDALQRRLDWLKERLAAWASLTPNGLDSMLKDDAADGQNGGNNVGS